MSKIITSLLLLFALPAQAEPSLSAEEFDAYTQGRTLYYGFEGEAYGVERYLDNRRVIWSFLDGNCKNGVWYEDGDLICFVYDDPTDPQCWSFSRNGDGLIARFRNSPDATELYEAQDLGDEMLCYGPDVGV